PGPAFCGRGAAGPPPAPPLTPVAQYVFADVARLARHEQIEIGPSIPGEVSVRRQVGGLGAAHPVRALLGLVTERDRDPALDGVPGEPPPEASETIQQPRTAEKSPPRGL